ncbi:transcriptional regulator, LacI family [Filimonas lacunae]|uniref:Transcriptional regulator, LacI family n=3 Tax=Filimonas lacunae TaxID=477680 RepID=A0A1N7KQ86_9BACT|nr:transcriptional regulator, LacI family [Filimonas lacunae]
MAMVYMQHKTISSIVYTSSYDSLMGVKKHHTSIQSLGNPDIRHNEYRDIFENCNRLQLFLKNQHFSYFSGNSSMSQPKEITIYDIARELNISATTVSRGLKGHPTINKNTRKKIAEKAKELGYTPNTFAGSLRSKRTNTIGVIVPRLNSYFMSSALAGMEHIANKHGYNLIISQSLENAKKEIENAHTMFNRRVDGLIISLSFNTENINHLLPFTGRNIPVIFFDRVFNSEQFTGVVIDNYAAAYEATKHLIQQGCKRIVHLAGNTIRNVYKDRLEGYMQALTDHQLKHDPKLVITSNLSEEAGIEAAQQIIQMTKKPDGIFAANDNCAIYCMIHLKQAGIRIPEDIAVVGFNNDRVSQIIEPALSTINYPGYSIGETTATHLINHLQGDTNIQSTNTIVLRTELIIRASSLKQKTG